MKYESVKLLFQQDKYVQIVSLLTLVVFGYCFYQLSTGLTKNLDREQQRTIYEVYPGNVTVKGEIYSGKNWILNKCTAPSGYCWDPITSRK